MGVQILLAISTYGTLAGTHPWSTRCLCVEIEIEENEDLNFETLFLHQDLPTVGEPDIVAIGEMKCKGQIVTGATVGRSKKGRADEKVRGGAEEAVLDDDRLSGW